MKAQKHLLTGLLLSCALCSTALAGAEGKSQAIASPKSAPHVRTYYLCAEEIDWDYTPDGKDMMMQTDFGGYSRVFTEHTEKRIGHTYRKAVFHEYTDASFNTLKPRPAALSHMGLLGPVIRGWMHAGPTAVALRTPCHAGYGWGAFQRSGPTGAWA